MAYFSESFSSLSIFVYHHHPPLSLYPSQNSDCGIYFESRRNEKNTMADQLQPGIIYQLAKGDKVSYPIVLQAHQAKFVEQPDGLRLRAMLNDGKYQVNSVYKTTKDDPIALNFTKYSYLKINKVSVSPLSNSGRTFLIISEIELIPGGERPEAPFTTIDDVFKQEGATTGDVEMNGNDDNSRSTTPAVVASAAPARKPVVAPKYDNLYNIDQLSPYQNSWTIKARVSYKGDMRTWSNQRGEGKLFNINLLDETGEIRATSFNAVADKYFDLLKEGKVYYVTKASIQMAKPQFSNLKHQYELHFDPSTVIEECEDVSDVPKLHYDFVPLSKLQSLEPNAVIDVIGVLKEVHDPFQIVAKSTGKPYDRRDIVLVDSTHFAMNVGLWNKMALEFDVPAGTVIAIKGARVQDFGGRSLSLTPSASIIDSPDIPEAHSLQGWYESQGKFEEFQTMSRDSGASNSTNLTSKESILSRKTIQQINDEKIGLGEKPDYFNIKAMISFIRSENISYPACQTEGCNKKVIEQSDGKWRCEKCDKNFDEPNHRYILTASVLDPTGQSWVTFFDDSAQKLIGKTANEVLKIKSESEDPSNESVDEHAYRRFMNSYCFKELVFNIRARQDDYNGTTRVRLNVVGLSELDLNNEIDAMCDIFDKYNV